MRIDAKIDVTLLRPEGVINRPDPQDSERKIKENLKARSKREYLWKKMQMFNVYFGFANVLIKEKIAKSSYENFVWIEIDSAKWLDY